MRGSSKGWKEEVLDAPNVGGFQVGRSNGHGTLTSLQGVHWEIIIIGLNVFKQSRISGCPSTGLPGKKSVCCRVDLSAQL